MGDVIISPTAGSGDITLENVRISGNIFASGGGKLNLKSTRAAGMVADQPTGSQSLVLSGQTAVPNLWLKGHALLDESGLMGAPGVVNVYSQDGGRLWNDLTLKGAHLDLLGTSTPTNVHIPTDSGITKINAAAQTHIAGTGPVRELVVGSPDVTYETKPTRITESGGHTANSSAGAIGSDSYGQPSESGTSPADYPKGTLGTPTQLKIYTQGNDIYARFVGDKNAKEGYTLVPIIDGRKQKAVEVSGAGKGTPPEHTDIHIIGEAAARPQVAFEVYANAVPKKHARSATARSANQTVYLTAGFGGDGLSITRNPKNEEYTISWGQIEFASDSRSSNIKPGGTTYSIDYTLRMPDGTVVYRPTGRASTTKTSYKIPYMPPGLADGTSIEVTVHAEVDTDVYPCVLEGEQSISDIFRLGDLSTPTGLTATLSKSGYGLTASWNAVADAENYTVTALVSRGTAVQHISQTVTGTSHSFSDLSGGNPDAITALSVKVVANAAPGSIYNSSQPAELSSPIAVPVVLSPPNPSSLSIELIGNSADTHFNASWAEVPLAQSYRVFATHYDLYGEVAPTSPAQEHSTTGTTHRFTDVVSEQVDSLSFTVQAVAHSPGWYRDSSRLQAADLRRPSTSTRPPGRTWTSP